MLGDLPTYYEAELQYLRNSAQEFAEKYPKIAARLVLGERDNPDPHVERLLEGFAFLAARIHIRLDEDFPEITDALLNLVYPHYLRPIPSMTVAQFELDPQQGKLTTGLKIPRESTVYSRPVGGSPCKFRTAYDTTLWPIEVAEADWRAPDKVANPIRGAGAAGVLRIVLRCAHEITFSRLALNSLRFHLRGEPNLVHTLYELLLNNCTQVIVRDPKNLKRPPLRLPADSVRAVGFEEDQALLPYPRRSFDGYRLLQEYFTFPQKFHFIEIEGLEPLAAAGLQEEAELLFFIAPFEREERWQTLEATKVETLRLGCTPLINLFPQTSEPILLKHTEYEYRIIPDVRRQRGMDIFSVDSVVSATPGSGEIIHYEPFFSFRHWDDVGRKQAFWYATRRESRWNDRLDTFLTLINVDSGRRVVPDVEAVTARLTCTNADLPSRLPFGSGASDFELEGGGPIRGIKSLDRPTPPISPKTGRAAFWRLVSHLALNHLSLVAEGREALQEVLHLYNFTDTPSSRRQIQAIRGLQARPHFARLISEHGISFARGYAVEMEIDEEAFAGAGVFLFASTIERFLGMYTSLNSFSQLAVRTPQRKEMLRQWHPRAGRKILM